MQKYIVKKVFNESFQKNLKIYYSTINKYNLLKNKILTNL